MGEATRLSASLTTSVTNVVSTLNSRKCDSTLLVKTLVTPIINYRSRLLVTMKNGRLVRKYGTRSSYILLSQDALISKKTRMFNQEIQVVGRICTVDNSINASSTPSNDALYEEFTLTFEGNITITENCPLNATTISENWTFSKMAKLRLPLVCSIISEKFDCSAIKFQSSRVKEIHLTEHRMKVLEQHFEEEKVAINSTVFIRSNIEIEENLTTPSSTFLETMKWPIIGSLGAILSLIVLGLIYISRLSKSNKEGVKVEINNAANANNESSSCSMDVANQVNRPAQHFIPQPEQFREEANQIFVGPLQIQ